VNWPSDDELLTAWQLLATDPTAGGAFVSLALRPLVDSLLVWQTKIDPDDAETVATDVLLWLVRKPEKYQPDKSPLAAFLRFVARRKLLSHFASERRHQAAKIPWDDVEFCFAARNESSDDDDAPSFAHPQLLAALDELSEVDRQLVELIRDGERDTDVFAAMMGLTNRPADERERAVKRAKDRIKVKLKRAVG
jgi:DNA-directed RNA polymerase specialized sigma24 family protein